MTLFRAFRENRDAHADDAAFLIAAGDRSVPITWRQFARDVETVAFLIETRAPGATIGLLGENSYEWIVAHAACLFSGATVVPLEVTLAPEEIASRLAFVGAKVLVHSALYRERARAAGRLAPGLYVAGFGTPGTDRAMEAARAAFERSGTSVFDRPPRDAAETAMIVFTSGTTSRPRGAELTLAGLSATCGCWAERLGLDPSARSLMLLPLHHSFGLSATYTLLMRAVPVGVCPDFRRIYDAVERFRADRLFLVPALAEIFVAKVRRRGETAEAALGFPVRWAVVGGAPLPSRLHADLEALGIAPLAAYGLTETTALYSISRADDRLREGTAGLTCPMAGMEMKVSDRGELLVRGPAVMNGYFREPARTAEVLSADGWFRTGDLGRIDADGIVRITGRASRTIVLSSGKKVAPEELEDRLLSLPGVLEAVVSGDGPSREIRAEIYTECHEAEIRERVDALNRELPVHMRIRAVALRREPFPRTPSGKIRAPAAPNGVWPRVPPPVVRRLFARRSARMAFVLALLALGVLAVNLLPLLLGTAGVEIPDKLRAALDFMEEFGEALLAAAAVAAYLVMRRLFVGEAPDGEVKTEGRK